MEGIALATEFVGSVFTYMSGIALLALATSVVIFGYMAEEESKGNRLYWAEWPVPETGETAKEEEILLAA